MDATALETQDLVVHGDRCELRLEAGHITIHKEATTQARPTEVSVAVAQVRGATLDPGGRDGPGWLHVAVTGGSSPPTNALAVTGDPHTLPLASRGLSAARRFVRLVERHVRERGVPPDPDTAAGPHGRVSTGVTVRPGPVPATPGAPEGPHGPDPEPAPMVAQLRELAGLHAAGVLTDDEFRRAKARVLDDRAEPPTPAEG